MIQLSICLATDLIVHLLSQWFCCLSASLLNNLSTCQFPDSNAHEPIPWFSYLPACLLIQFSICPYPHWAVHLLVPLFICICANPPIYTWTSVKYKLVCQFSWNTKNSISLETTASMYSQTPCHQQYQYIYCAILLNYTIPIQSKALKFCTLIDLLSICNFTGYVRIQGDGR